MNKRNHFYIAIIFVVISGCNELSKNTAQNSSSEGGKLGDTEIPVSSCIKTDKLPPCNGNYEELKQLKVNGKTIETITHKDLRHGFLLPDSIDGFTYYYGKSSITYNKRVVSIFICDSSLVFDNFLLLGQNIDSLYTKYPCTITMVKSQDYYYGQERLSMQLTHQGNIFLRVYFHKDTITELWYHLDDSDYDSYNK